MTKSPGLTWREHSYIKLIFALNTPTVRREGRGGAGRGEEGTEGRGEGRRGADGWVEGSGDVMVGEGGGVGVSHKQTE